MYFKSECISCIENDLLINKSSNSWKVNNDSRELQHYIAHKDSLRQQLVKVRHLRDEYENNIRLREALIKMIKISKSRDCDNEWRENARILIEIEKQLQLMIGLSFINKNFLLDFIFKFEKKHKLVFNHFQELE